MIFGNIEMLDFYFEAIRKTAAVEILRLVIKMGMSRADSKETSVDDINELITEPNES